MMSIYLYSVLWKVGFQRQHLSGVHIRVVGVLKRLLQLFQLQARENRPEMGVNS
ncbi:hypothetical protein DPMN_087379 [Dreissena polymorpha]|uniref:Uncharacterized protein n=1 Tax=Dreissena polymorpha TaxID=45954 RepID=A0A9D4KS41_DREPO|nr:hypothetical protein DPMN_087379 [Dreissena polymorpha]